MSPSPSPPDESKYTIYLTPNGTSVTKPESPKFITTRLYLHSNVPYFTTFLDSHFTSGSVSHLDVNLIAPESLSHILNRPYASLPASPTPSDLLDLATTADYLLITPLFNNCMHALGSITDANCLAESLRLLHDESKFLPLREDVFMPQLKALAKTSLRTWKKPVLSLPESVREQLLEQMGLRLKQHGSAVALAVWKQLCYLRRAVKKVDREQIWNDTILNDVQSECERALLRDFKPDFAVIREGLRNDGLGGEVRNLVNHALEGKEMVGTQDVWIAVNRLAQTWTTEDGEEVPVTEGYQTAVKEANNRVRCWWTKNRLDRVLMDGGFQRWERGVLREFEQELGLQENELELLEGE